MKNGIAIMFLTIILGILVGVKHLTTSNTNEDVIYQAGKEVEKAIANCEANLPRNQKCVVVGYEFKIEEIEE